MLCLTLPPSGGNVSTPSALSTRRVQPCPRLPHAIAATLQKTTVLIHVREGAEREPLLVATVPSGWWGYLVDGLGLGVVRVEEANELGGAHFGRMRVH